ncbi:poly-beta-1,6-N-acetyl-D-glucosamine N-deacetylase PgaB [Lysobacter panacisoli]|uniref:poly-beta-1,6-N-acetyl-D-glucosamine N-deacetylase PgaB n=1 Tax=Lysobacter panacisoli TaxID=1255263 RepID=UPI00131CCACD|nr:poly-beta-1,6-N-acetyl-D-glucosamine N-deacetylase PgaB [Lysobacter panacisoli]
MNVRTTLAALSILTLLALPVRTTAQEPSQPFVSIALHDVVDTRAELDEDAITSDRLVALFEWLAGNGWTAISLDDIERARTGAKPLPPRAILITVDDGRQSLYARVYPLALAYRTPIVAAIVGSWMDTPANASVRYGERNLPRTGFISWAQAREMQASGLVEFASHSHALHDVVIANPQGNVLPAAQNLAFANGRYESPAAFRTRIDTDLVRSRERMREELGRAPRAIAWPYGRYNQDALDVATSRGFRFALTLSPAPADAAHPLDIGRFLPTGDPLLGITVANLRFEDPWPAARRVVEVDPARVFDGDAEASNARLGRVIERLVAIGATHVAIDAATLSADGRIDGTWFPTSLLPVRNDVLPRLAAQMRARAGVSVAVRLPHIAVLRTLGDEQRALALYADLARHVPFEAMLLEDVDALGESTASAQDDPADVRARRQASDSAGWRREDAFALQAFRIAERTRSGLELFWLAPSTHPLDRPSGLAELTLVPRGFDAAMLPATPRLDVPLSRRTGLWWTTDSRVDPAALVRAMRAFQVDGGTVFGWRPDDPLSDTPKAAIVAPAFSSRDAPLRRQGP